MNINSISYFFEIVNLKKYKLPKITKKTYLSLDCPPVIKPGRAKS